MAKVAFGGGVSNIQGSIAGNTFTRTKAGSAVRNRMKPTNPATPAQLAQRALISRLSKAWRLLTEDQRTAWGKSADGTKMKDKCGNDLVLTGHQFYVKINSLREAHSDAADAATPPGFGDFTAGIFDAEAADNIVNTVGPVVQIGIGAGAAEGMSIDIQASGPRSAGIGAYKGDLRSVYQAALTADEITAGAVDFATEYVAKFGTLNGTAGKVVTFSARQYDEGTLSNPVVFRVTVISS
jgi:hypothetical protein